MNEKGAILSRLNLLAGKDEHMKESPNLKEAEVSLRTALFFIKNHIAADTVKISLDGAHIKIKDTVIFDVKKFMSENGCRKVTSSDERWQGLYEVDGYPCKLEVHSRPGEGDIVVPLVNGGLAIIESKGSAANKKGNQEYRVLREALGQILTNGIDGPLIKPYVAAPYTEKNYSLADKWSIYELIKRCNIEFILVDYEGNVLVI